MRVFISMKYSEHPVHQKLNRARIGVADFSSARTTFAPSSSAAWRPFRRRRFLDQFLVAPLDAALTSPKWIILPC